MQYGFTNQLERQRLAVTIGCVATAVALSILYAPQALAILLGALAAICFIKRPYELLLLMVFMVPFNVVFRMGPVPLAFEVIKILAWVPFLMTRRERPAFISSRYNRWFALLAAIIVLSLIRALDLPFTVKECVRLGSNIGLVYIALNLVDSQTKLLQIFRVLTVSTFFVACYGFYQWAIQDYGALFWVVNPRLDTSLAHYRDYFWQWRGRIISVLTSEMELGHYFNLCIPIGIALWMTEGRKRLSSKWLLMTVCMLVGLVLTFTFGAWLALAGTCGLAILLFGGGKKWKLLLALTSVFAIAAVVLAVGPLRPFLESKVGGTAAGSLAFDAATRLYGWKLALQAWWSHPLLGLGIGNFEFFSAGYDFALGAQSQGSSPHQTFLYLLANYGLVGTVGVLAIMLSSIRSGIRMSREHASLKVFSAALAFALAVNLIGWFSDDSTYLGPHTSYLLWLLIGLSEVVRNIDHPVLKPAAVL